MAIGVISACTPTGRVFKEYLQWPPCRLEQVESLEQLRALWHGRRIHVAEAVAASPAGVDTEEDIARVEAKLRAV